MCNLWGLFVVGLLVFSGQIYAQVADPTKPLNYQAGADASGVNAQNAIKVTSILISDSRKVAIINGQSLEESQAVKGVGAVVKKIEADGVVLQQNGKAWRVTLDNTAIRK